VSSIHKIPTKHVEVGMFVSEKTPGIEKTGLKKRGLISKEKTLHRLRSSDVREVYIDTSKGKSSTFSSPVVKNEPPSEPTVAYEEERVRAEAVYGEARSLVGSLISDVKMGNAIEVGPVEELGREISDSVLANANALLCLSQIREKDKYLMEHSINVGILMGVFARHLGYQDDVLHQMVTGAILHDLGKVRVSDQILHKTGKLTDAEWKEMQNHVLYGEEVLMKSPGISDIAISICAQHHEKLNGKGYPRGLQNDDISMAGRMASIVDIYDAITADRCYHKGKSPNETMKILSRLGGEELDINLVYDFIRCMSVYPVGTMVELSNQCLGVVTIAHATRADRPTVKLFYDNKQRQYIREKVIELSSEAHLGLSIIRAVDPNKLSMKVRNFI